jgi:hypothetical protein
MIEIMPESQGDLLVIRISGKITHHDFEDVLIPRLETMLREHPKLRLLDLIEEFSGWEVGVMWDKTKFLLQHGNVFTKIAAVGAPQWIARWVEISSHFVATEMKTFPADQMEEARKWLQG